MVCKSFNLLMLGWMGTLLIKIRALETIGNFARLIGGLIDVGLGVITRYSEINLLTLFLKNLQLGDISQTKKLKTQASCIRQ